MYRKDKNSPNMFIYLGYSQSITYSAFSYFIIL